MTRMIKVTYTVVAHIEPYGFDTNDAELQRAVDMVMDEPLSYYESDTASCDAEFVEVAE